MNESVETNSISKLAIAGGRGRAAAAHVATAGAELAIALKRALPFLARRRTGVAAEAPTVVLMSELDEDTTLLHRINFMTRPSNTAGILAFDNGALGCILDGILGGGGDGAPLEGTLTSAQVALASRVSASVLRAVSEALGTKLGLTLEANTKVEPEGAAVVVAITIETGGRVLVALPLSSVSREESAPPAPVDSGIAAAMIDVELDVVCELGKVRLPIQAIAALKVGDVLRLPLSVDERARVCAGGSLLFYGRPTASGEIVGVAIERQASTAAAKPQVAPGNVSVFPAPSPSTAPRRAA